MRETLEHYVFQCAVLVISSYCLVQAWRQHWWEVPLILGIAIVAFFLIWKYVKWLVDRDMSREGRGGSSE